MAGLFPSAGVTPDKATNSSNPTVTNDCELLFHKSRCRPRFDPAAANAIISELTNAINVIKDYDCTKLTNFKEVLEYIKNLCNQPTRAFNIDNAYLAGCFSGVSGLVDAQVILDYIRSQLPGGGGSDYAICNLGIYNTPAPGDSIGICRGTEDARITLNVIAGWLGIDPDISTSAYSVGTIGGVDWIGNVTSIPNRQIETSLYDAIIVRDLRSTSGGQNPQDPGWIMINGDDIVNYNEPSVTWSYGRNYVLFKARDPQYPGSTNWFRLHESGGAWRLPGSPGDVQYLRFDQNYNNVAVYAAQALAGAP